jgi:hypothetical protein
MDASNTALKTPAPADTAAITAKDFDSSPDQHIIGELLLMTD